MRYDQLLTLIDEHKPRVIVEVGVARAERAVAMCERALLHRNDVKYIGYDVFETKDAAFHAAAYNMKKVDSQAGCSVKLAALRRRWRLPGRPDPQGLPSCFQFALVVGDTRDTLHGKHVEADLAFIDGDHRVDAIRRDYEALQDSAVVVLDDYYTPDERGCPDINVVGCNQLVEELNYEQWSTFGRADILPMKDQVRDGGLVQMAVVRRA